MHRFVFLVLLLSSYFSAQNPPTQPEATTPQETASRHARPKIGVALEGGGALGLAHIGVLHWFEEHHIPIDYIAGTSMGGLVGGLYATGKSPNELEAIVRAQKWDVIIGGSSPYEDLSFRRKEDATAYPNSLILGLKHGLSPPGGLNQGQQITALIDRETLRYSEVNSFDDLPIPFRCVATELVSGEQVVFKQGELGEALRATMSIPGVFAPVREGEHVYVDGGLVGNLPTEVVRQMGADIVIGVHLETAPAKAEQIQSIFSVLGRSIDVVIRQNEIRGLANADLIVKVDLHDFTSMQYDKAQTIIERGKEAAVQKEALFLPYTLDESAWQDYVRARDDRKKKSNVGQVQFVKVEGVSGQGRKNIERSLQSLIGSEVDPDVIDPILTRLTGTGRFARAGYRAVHSNGEEGLVVTLFEYSYAPPTLQLGFEVDGSETSDVTFTQAARLTFLDIAGFGSEWRTDFLLGNTYGVQTEFYKPLGPLSSWFFAPQATATDSGIRIYSKQDPVAEYRLRRANLAADLGYAFDRFSEFRFGYEFGYLSAHLRLGTPNFSSVEGVSSGGRLRFTTDHRDDAVIPREGYRVQTTLRFLDHYPSAGATIPDATMSLEYFRKISQPGSIFASAEGGTTFGKDQQGIPLYFLGGPSRLSAYGSNELFGNQFYLFRAGYLHELFTLPPFVGKNLYAIGAYEVGKVYGAVNESKFPNDASAGLLMETAFGPLFVGGSVGDTGHRKLFFQLGKIF